MQQEIHTQTHNKREEEAMHTATKYYQIRHIAIALLIAMLFNVCNNQSVGLYILLHCTIIDVQESEVLTENINRNVWRYLLKRKASLTGM